MGDFNGDGYLDLVVANAGAEPETSTTAQGSCCNRCSGSYGGFGRSLQRVHYRFSTPWDLQVEISTEMVKLGFGCFKLGLQNDIDFDRQRGFFLPEAPEIETAANPALLVAGDFNGDGKLDWRSQLCGKFSFCPG